MSSSSSKTMVLPALSSQDSAEAERVIAEMVQSLVPQPTEGDSRSRLSADPYRQVLEQIADRLKINPRGDLSAHDQQRVLEFLSQQLKLLVLPPDRAQSIRTRLGEQGRLGLSQYRILFRDSFKGASARGIRTSWVQNALTAPDEVQHLRPNVIRPAGEYPAASLYAKRHADKKGGEDYTLLVIAERKNDVQEVTTAWRLDHDVFDISSIKEPLDLLRQFVDLYGIDFKIAGSESRRFVFYETFPVSEGKSEVMQVNVPAKATVESQLIFSRRGARSEIEVALAYVIDVTRHMNRS